MRWLKIGLVSVLSLATAAPIAVGQPVAPSVVGPTRALDGEATPANCEQFGYRPPGGVDGRPYVRGGVGVTGSRTPQPQMTTTAPVQAVTGEQARVEGLVRQQDLSAQRPTPFPPPPPPPPPGVVISGTVVGPQAQQDTERYPDAPTNAVVMTAENPVSTLSIDIDTASYANVRRFLNEGSLPPRDAVRVEELVNYFDYGYPRPQSRSEPFAVFTEVTASPWSEGRQILHVGLQGYELHRRERPPLNLVFLIDVSGSMSSLDKLPLAQQALNTLIDQLRPEDRVAIAVYAGAAGAVLQPTPGDQRLRIRCAVNALHSGGSTAGGAGLALAYQMAERNFDRDRVNRVVLVTDGDFNVGVTSDQRLEDFVSERRESGVYLSVYGFGRGNYNDSLMQSIAQSGNGTAGYIDSLAEANRAFRDDFSGSIFPIADDVKIQIEFNPSQVAEYRLIGYETRLLNREDFNNDAVDAGEAGSGSTVTAIYEITPPGGPTQVDPLRYAPPTATGDRSGELAFVRVRYKLPGAEDSRLMEQAVSARAVTASSSTRWALAVAAFGQRLRGDPWMSDDYGWDEIERLASGARGEDRDGLRTEFVGLIERASVLDRRTP